jgi:hypothetical protein
MFFVRMRNERTAVIATMERLGERVLKLVVPEAKASACTIYYTPNPDVGTQYANATDCTGRHGCAWNCGCSQGWLVTWGHWCY